MPQYIGKKLDFLMTLTHTKNSALARALHFDSSHIRRMRSCTRGLPRSRSFVEPAAEYFARHIRDPYQIRGAEEALCPGRPWPEDEAAQAGLIAAWLPGDEAFFFAGQRRETRPSDRASGDGEERFYFGQAPDEGIPGGKCLPAAVGTVRL